MRRWMSDPTAWFRGLVGFVLIALVAAAAFLSSIREQPSSTVTPIETSKELAATSAATATSPPTATSQPAAAPLPTHTSTATLTLSLPHSPALEPTATSELSNQPASGQAETIPIYGYEIINVFPHDPGAWVQGLIYVDDMLYESTGRYGASSLRKVELVSGEILPPIISLPEELYGEGMTIFGDKIFQITWKNQVGLVYDKESFALLHLFSYPTEGWGITHDGRRLIMSDGTATLYFWDPETLTEIGQVEVFDSVLKSNVTATVYKLAEIGRIEVFDDQGPVVRLNELEYIKGEIYANVWQTDRIARIDPDSGRVISWVVLDGLLSETDQQQPVDVLNGIAYDARNDRLFVTGKLWPKLFEIKLK